MIKLIVGLRAIFLFILKILFPSESFEEVTPTFIPPTPTSIPEATVNIGLVGDLGLGRFITANARQLNDFSYSFEKVSPWLQLNDFNLANLESPIIDNCPTVFSNTFKFCGDPKFLPYLKDNKFILNLANNHIFNYGQDGFSQTKNYLDSRNILSFYSHGQSDIFLDFTINGLTFGFLGFDFITNPSLDTQTVIDLVKLYNPQVDWLIVSLHWGNEYKENPEKWRIDLAYLLIENGADIIHGHHPHVWQEYEIYQNKPIFYSLGNFIFDQNWSKATSETNIIKLTLDKFSIRKIEKFPVQIKNNSQPVIFDQ